MAGNLQDLANRLDQYADSFAPEAHRIKQKAAKVVVKDLVANTPVDSSKALSNWLASTQTPARSRIEAHSPGVGGSSRQSSMATAISLALAVIEKAKPGQSIFISNSLPYIRRLNDGYSNQAPAGFVERAELLAGNAIRDETVKV